jgi:DNA-binding transcriptional ArsR family regulator
LAQDEILTPEGCERIAEIVSVLANPLRVRIVCLLRQGPRTVSQLTEALQAKQPNISQHLRILYDRGYLVRKRDQREVYYSLRSEDVLGALRAVADMAGVPGPRD